MTASPSAHAAGQTLSGTYRLERMIAEGGMGMVYEATHVRLPRRFAVKVLQRPADSTESGIALERFKREARVASALKNTHIVQIYDYQVAEGGFPYIVMELLEGEDLAQRLRRAGSLPAVQVARIVDQIADALSAAHAHGVVHRDLKPANVFLNREPEPDFVKVLDFGVSKMVSWATITRADALVGTPLYMSPEQAGGGGEVTSLSDVFALGVIAYELLTGKRAFAGKSIPAILKLVVEGDPPPPSQTLGAAARDVDAVFAQVLAKDMRLRYRSGTEFAQALRAALQPLLPLAASVLHASETAIGIDRYRPGGSNGNPSQPPGATASTAPDTLADPATGSTSAPPSPSPSPPSHVSGEAVPVRAASRPPRLDPPRLVAAAALLVLLASAITVGVRKGRGPSTRSGAVDVRMPPAAPAAIPPSEVRIAFRLTPSNAQVVLDERPITGATVVVPWRSEPRRLRVTARGYRTLERAIDATLDRELTIVLDPDLGELTPQLTGGHHTRGGRPARGRGR